jgi:hypothetical protein
MLPTGKGRIKLARGITEAQMVMSNHEVNTRREPRDCLRSTASGSGARGCAPSALARPYSPCTRAMRSRRGLAALSGARLDRVPRGLAALDLVAAARPRWSCSTASPRRCSRRRERLAAAAEALDDAWFRAWETPSSASTACASCCPPQGHAHRDTSPPPRWRWFRTRKPLAAHA